MRILAIEPYLGLSHKAFLEGYRRYSRHEVEIWALPPRRWKWRMRGSAYHFASRAREAQKHTPPTAPPDVVLASDFLNLADWRALCPRAYRDLPCLLYFHENQVCYPLAAHAPHDHHYGWVNLSSALAADHILFNSRYHRDQFLRVVGQVLEQMPDAVPPGLAAGLRAKSDVFPVGIDLEPHERLRRTRSLWSNRQPVLLWNHRWEHDKNPEGFVEALCRLKENGVDYRVVICGESSGRSHAAFDRASRELGDRILHLGFLPDAETYRRAAAGCDVVVSTARHEFFGVSVVEAICLGCLPVLPRALSYPEILPPHLHTHFLYPSPESLVEFLEEFLRHPPLEHAEELRQVIARFDWRRLAPQLDAILEALTRV